MHNAFTNLKFCCLFPVTTVLLALLHIGQFSKKFTKHGHIFCFSVLIFVCVKNTENFLLSTDRNMVFPKILSHIPLLYDQWLPRYVNYPHANCDDNIWGGAGWKMGANLQKQILSKFWTICRDLRTALFSISKKKFFHSTLLTILSIYFYKNFLRK